MTSFLDTQALAAMSESEMSCVKCLSMYQSAFSTGGT